MTNTESTSPEPKYIHVNTGSNRRERRHGYTRTGRHYIIPAQYRELATNTPYRKSDATVAVEAPD
jgi:hypothetical protein